MNTRTFAPIAGTTILSPNVSEIIASTSQQGSQVQYLWKVASFGNLDAVPTEAGIYCCVIPSNKLPQKKEVILHGRTFGKEGARRQLQLTFRYEAMSFRDGAGDVIYVGKASDLRARLKGHLSVNEKATTNQVLRGLAGQLSHQVKQVHLQKEKELLLEHGGLFYFVHQHRDEKQNHANVNDMGESFAADRDLLEIKLIAKYAPPFNIKAER